MAAQGVFDPLRRNGGAAVSIRFPDLQVLVPRSAEVSRIAAVAAHGLHHEQEVRAQERLARLAEAQRKVTQAAEHEPRVDPDGSGSGAREGLNQRRPRRPREAAGASDSPSLPSPLGQRVDVRA